MTSDGPRHHVGDATLGSAPFEFSAIEPTGNAVGNPPGVEFDPAEFMHFVEREGLTEGEARELLLAIWNILLDYTALAFGMHAVQQVADKSERVVPSSAESVLSSKPHFKKAKAHQAEMRSTGRASGRKDS